MRTKSEDFLDRRLLTTWLSLELALWCLILAAAVVSRFIGLGERAMSHDESQHALFSFYFFRDGTYTHDPVTHGPLLFHLNALAYNLFGTADWSARFFPAAAGVILVGAVYPLRRFLGSVGALAAAAMLTCSPALLTYSRYLRNDIYICLFALVWATTAFRYLESRSRPWLYLLAASMGLAFVTKETSFIFGLIIGGFCLSVFLSGVGRANRAEITVRAGTLAFLMATIVLPFIAPLIHLVMGWPVTDYTGEAAFRRTLISGGLLFLMALLLIFVSNRWKWIGDRLKTVSVRQWLSIGTVFWSIQVLLFTSMFTNIRGGLTSGIVGSLGYWLTQQEVGRGGQPWFYYGMLSALYECLPLTLAGTALVYLLARRLKDGRREREKNSRGTSRIGVAKMQELFVLFLGWWVLSSLLLYSIAGEKMPWLVTQISLPMILLGGWFFERIIDQLRSVGWKRSLAVGMAASILMVALTRLLTAEPSLDRTISPISETVKFIGALLVAGLMTGLLVRAMRRSGPRLWSAVYVGIVALLFILTVRLSYLVSFRDSESARYLLVYAHATPDIKATMRDISTLSSLSEIPEAKVMNDAETMWPFGWYLERESRSLYIGDSVNSEQTLTPFAAVGPENDTFAGQFAVQGYSSRKRRLIWWPVEFYKGLGLNDILRGLWTPDSRKKVLDYFLNGDRSSSENWPSVKGFQFYFRRDLISGDSKERVCRVNIVESLSGTVMGSELKQPQGISVGPSGVVAVADTENHRVLILKQEGQVLAIGGPCSLSRNSGQGCKDPDGNGPLELGDGQFDSPMGVLLGSNGELFVADTWNGRIQVFTLEGRFLRKWGTSGSTDGRLSDPYLLYGPRDLTMDSDGNLLVSDTGNKRIIRYSSKGDFLDQFGGYGQTPSLLDEPVGIVSPSEEFIWVADTWNRRIQIFELDGTFVERRDVSGWETRSAPFRPYLAFDRVKNLLYASDPENRRILVFTVDGETPDEHLLPVDSEDLPVTATGLAIDEKNRKLLLCDSRNNRILVADLP